MSKKDKTKKLEEFLIDISMFIENKNKKLNVSKRENLGNNFARHYIGSRHH